MLRVGGVETFAAAVEETSVGLWDEFFVLVVVDRGIGSSDDDEQNPNRGPESC